MDFEQRKQIAIDKVVGFLADFVPPRGLADDRMADRVHFIADAIARRLPIGPQYEDLIDRLLTKLRDTHESNSWPPQAAFVSAMPQGESRKAAPSSYKSDNRERIPKLMEMGDPVPEAEVWKAQPVDAAILDNYRKGCVENWKDIYRSQAEPMLAEKYGPIVHQYFQRRAAE